jgi:hypothetical protein
LGPPTSPSPCLPLDLRANAQVEPMEEEEGEGDRGSGVLQIEEREHDWEPEHHPMEECTFEAVMVALRDKKTFESLMVALRDNSTFEMVMGAYRAKIALLYAPIFKQQRVEKYRKTAELDRLQMLRLKKEKEEADEVKWKMEKMEEEDDHTPQRNKRGFARPAALTPYGTVLRVSQ